MLSLWSRCAWKILKFFVFFLGSKVGLLATTRTIEYEVFGKHLSKNLDSGLCFLKGVDKFCQRAMNSLKRGKQKDAERLLFQGIQKYMRATGNANF